ncbi:transactivator protein [Melochia yellow mosaic virus]|uniref:Transcriptional activator protein n=1 Tax=Melochia yellow mosaic virus TaxID=1742595 RepID=A0A0P0KF45_9GEMI|nr:transactivator protein [Melochia yellow mosaic virus]ALK27182.1 transactivator protein [Melochia yellow mosaic virus]
MRRSSSSTPPSIKPQHRAAKRRATRRRRIDLNCGCSLYIHINCANNGFAHRGTTHYAAGGEWRVFLGSPKSPVFQDNQRGGSTIHQHQDIPRPDPVQPQPQESVGSPQGVHELPSLDDFPDSFWADIFS